MSGTYCERQEHKKSSFDKRSFRWKQSGKARILIGCPKGKWQPKKERCKVGTRAYKILVRAKASCRRGEKRIHK